MHQEHASTGIASSRFSPRNVGRAVVGLAMLSLGVWFLLAMAALHDGLRKLRTIDMAGLRTFQSEMTAIQHLANIKTALERDLGHGADPGPSKKKK
jgi:hypothetical protein